MAMTNDPANPGNDPDLKPDPQLAAAYRAAADELPPTQLDDAIRAAARREAGAGPRRAGPRRWQLPLSLAAVVVLSVTLVTLMREQGVDRPQSLTLPVPQQGVPAVPVAPEAKRDRAQSREKTESPAPAMRQSTTPPLPAAPAPEAASRPPPAIGEPAAAAAAKSRDGVAAEAMEDRAARRRVAPALRSAPVPAPAQAPAAGMAADGAAESAAAGAAAMASPRAALWQDLEGEAPEQWRQRILEWRRAGRTADAAALAAEFRRRFPDQSLPER